MNRADPPRTAHPQKSATENDRFETAPLVTLEDLRVHFRTTRGIVHAVDGVSMEIGDQETVGLVGETGSGKSVTARSLLRLIQQPPGIYAGGRALFRPKMTCRDCTGVGCERCGQTGRVGIPCPQCQGSGCSSCGETGRETIDLLKLSDRRMRRIRGNRIAMIFQDPGKSLNPGLSIRHQLAEVFAYHRAEELLRDAGLSQSSVGYMAPLLRRAARLHTTFWERRLLQVPPLRAHAGRLQATLSDRIATALADTRIPNPKNVMKCYPHELSGGMKQRVMIAQALSCDPDLLIADEPTTALDVTIQARILDLIADMQKRHHTAVLYVSHDLSLVRRISNRVAVLYGGRIAEVGPTEQIFAQPLHPYTRGLLAAVPTQSHRRGELSTIEGNVPEFIAPPPLCRFHTRCPHASQVCASLDPKLAIRRRPNHRAACFLYDDAEELGVGPSEMPTREPAIHGPP